MFTLLTGALLAVAVLRWRWLVEHVSIRAVRTPAAAAGRRIHRVRHTAAVRKVIRRRRHAGTLEPLQARVLLRVCRVRGTRLHDRDLEYLLEQARG